jgi:hypothetical protein
MSVEMLPVSLLKARSSACKFVRRNSCVGIELPKKFALQENAFKAPKLPIVAEMLPIKPLLCTSSFTTRIEPPAVPHITPVQWLVPEPQGL